MRGRAVPLPAVPTDRVRLHVALYKMARALGLPMPYPHSPDHVMLEDIANAVTPALAAAWRTAQDEALLEDTTTENPYDQTR